MNNQRQDVGLLLDTNVISEVMKPKPINSVQAWLDAQNHENISISSISVAEILFGIEVLPKGKRKETLTQAFNHFMQFFDSRVLAFDINTARHYAELAGVARNVGLGFPVPDAYIAAIAKAHGLAVVTRDVAPFRAVGLAVVNPFE